MFDLPPRAWHDAPPDAAQPPPEVLYADVPTRLETLPDGRESITIGDVSRLAEFGHLQGRNDMGFLGTCGLCSCETVLNQFDVPVSERDVVEYAAGHGLCEVSADPADCGGTTSDMQARILTDYGVPAHVERGQSLEDLAANVEQGRGVIVSANAGVLWNDAYAYEFGQANHAVAVIGVARSPGTGDVQGFYINDSGTGAAGRFVPASEMTEAWLETGGACVVTDMLRVGENDD